MAGRLGVSLATFFLLGFAVAAGAEPQVVKPPGNDDCMACHGDADAKRESGTSIAVDQKVFADSKHGPLNCVDCHKDLATLQEYPHPEKLAKVTCASCHEEEGGKYHDSIHSWAKEKAGLTTAAPACADCHGKHDIRGTDDSTARVFRTNIPATCGSCHQGVLERYNQGVHATARKAGNDAAPVCADCHTAHTIQRADTDKFRLDVTTECGTCHSQVVESFRRTFHGKVTELGFVACRGLCRLPQRTRDPPCGQSSVDCLQDAPCADMREVSPGGERELRQVRPASRPAQLRPQPGDVVGQ